MPQTRLSLALSLVVILLNVAIIARNSETAEYVIYYLHRTDVAGASPSGKTMNTTAPSGEETTLSMALGTYYYWYTDPPLTAGTISTGTWTLRVYISWVGTGNVKGTFNLTLVSQEGDYVATIVAETTGGPLTTEAAWYEISAYQANPVTVTENDRVRLGLRFNKDATLYYDGNTGNEATEQSRLEFTGSAPPPIPESPIFGTLAFVLIAFTVYILYSKRTLMRFKQQ